MVCIAQQAEQITDDPRGAFFEHFQTEDLFDIGDILFDLLAQHQHIQRLLIALAGQIGDLLFGRQKLHRSIDDAQSDLHYFDAKNLHVAKSLLFSRIPFHFNTTFLFC